MNLPNKFINRFAVELRNSKRKWGLIVSSCIVAVICASYYLMHFRYLPPAIPNDIDQIAQRKAIYRRIGVDLPPDARIVAETDGRPWDGTTGFYLWKVFMPGHFQFPHLSEGFGMFADKQDMIRSVETGFWPRKILAPEGYTFHSWKSGNVDIRITAVKGKVGTYAIVETYHRGR